MNVFIKTFLLAIIAFSVASFNPPGKEKKKRKFIDPANIDLSVKPGDNFYLYANGNWLKRNTVPASKTRWGSFDELREESSNACRHCWRSPHQKPPVILPCKK